LKNLDYWYVIIGKTEMTEDHWLHIDSCYNKWTMNKFISNDLGMLQFCDKLSRFTNIPNIVHFKALRQFYRDKFGKSKLYIGYIPIEKIDPDIELISECYNISLSKAVNYHEMISDDELNNLREQKKERDKILNQSITKKKGGKI